jgi:hypothetical protein
MLAAAAFALVLGVADVLPLITFDDDPVTGNRKWQALNDPVMGGQSHSAFTAETSYGRFSGLCAIVPFLKAPGFCKIATTHGMFEKPRLADASAYIGGSLYLEVRSSTPEYKGYKVDFSAKNTTRPRPGMHHSSPSFKADFVVPPGTDFTTVKVPFDSFSVDWSDYTGRCDTKDPTGEQHVCCSETHPEVCPQAHHLAQLTSFEIWSEGVEGNVTIELKSISAGP